MFSVLSKLKMKKLLYFMQIRNFGLSTLLSRKTFSRPPGKYTKAVSQANDERLPQENSMELEADFTDKLFRTPQMGHHVLVIQPHIKWGTNKRRNTTPALQLEEAISLIKTLNNWQVADSCVISLLSLDKKEFFGKGNLDLLKTKVRSNKNISAVFVSVDVLKGFQQQILENKFGVPVFDRYRIVIQIFREHAKTREAKLQIELAEIPYLWMKANYEIGGDRWGSGESFTETHVQFVKDRESKLKLEIAKLRAHREVLRQKRIKNEFPTVAVVGYTNAGKTSLIKALTDSDRLQPEDKLFATLDVTVHEGLLPCQLRVLYIDTIGFISDIPTNLLESFTATLEDALHADLIIHVRDASHPDRIAQNDNVMEILRKFNLSEDILQNLITVDNKIDLVSETCPESKENEQRFLVSVKTKSGLNSLVEKVEEAILKITKRKVVYIRVATGGQEYIWLHKQAAVSSVTPDAKDGNFSVLQCILSDAVLEKFRHYFIKNKK